MFWFNTFRCNHYLGQRFGKLFEPQIPALIDVTQCDMIEHGCVFMPHGTSECHACLQCVRLLDVTSNDMLWHDMRGSEASHLVYTTICVVEFVPRCIWEASATSDYQEHSLEAKHASTSDRTRYIMDHPRHFFGTLIWIRVCQWQKIPKKYCFDTSIGIQGHLMDYAQEKQIRYCCERRQK